MDEEHVVDGIRLSGQGDHSGGKEGHPFYLDSLDGILGVVILDFGEPLCVVKSDGLLGGRGIDCRGWLGPRENDIPLCRSLGLHWGDSCE